MFTGSPSPADSHAQGQAIFDIAADQQSFDYKLIVANIENVVQAHIHCGPVGVNGPIVVWLYPDPSSTSALQGPTGRHDGVLVAGTVNNTVDPPAEQPRHADDQPELPRRRGELRRRPRAHPGRQCVRERSHERRRASE